MPKSLLRPKRAAIARSSSGAHHQMFFFLPSVWSVCSFFCCEWLVCCIFTYFSATQNIPYWSMRFGTRLYCSQFRSSSHLFLLKKTWMGAFSTNLPLALFVQMSMYMLSSLSCSSGCSWAFFLFSMAAHTVLLGEQCDWSVPWRGCAWSARVFGRMAFASWPPHKHQDPGFQNIAPLKNGCSYFFQPTVVSKAGSGV